MAKGRCNPWANHSLSYGGGAASDNIDEQLDVQASAARHVGGEPCLSGRHNEEELLGHGDGCSCSDSHGARPGADAAPVIREGPRVAPAASAKGEGLAENCSIISSRVKNPQVQ